MNFPPSKSEQELEKLFRATGWKPGEGGRVWWEQHKREVAQLKKQLVKLLQLHSVKQQPTLHHPTSVPPHHSRQQK